MVLKKRRRPTIAAGMSGTRDTLVMDIKADQQYADQLARQKEADAKRAAAESWAKESNRVRELAQQLQDGVMSLKDFNAEIDASKGKFTDNSNDLEALRRAAIRNRDTQKYNDYINGAIDYKSFEDFTNSRKSDGGDLAHLNGLLAQARANEDKAQYSSYANGTITFEQLTKYRDDRKADGGDMTKLDGYVAQAQTNENKINDQAKLAMYNAGQLPASEYTSYIDDRITKSVSPTEASQLRAAKKTVENNEVLKKADDVRAEYEAEQIDGGTAAARLLAIRSSSNDAGVQKSILTLVGQIQAKDAQAARAGSGSASAAVNRMQDQIRLAVNDAQVDYDKINSEIAAASGKAGIADYAKLSDRLFMATAGYKNSLAIGAKNSPDPLWGQHFGTTLTVVDQSFSEKLFTLATTIATNMQTKTVNEQTGKNLSGAADAAKFLIVTASQNPYMSPEDRKALIEAGQQTLQTAMSDWTNSAEGIQFRDFVDNRTNELLANGGAGVKFLSDKFGIRAPSNPAQLRSLVQQLLLEKPDAVRAALAAAGERGFADQGLRDTNTGLGKFAEGISSDEFSKQLAGMTETFRILNDANMDLYRKSGIYGLNTVETAIGKITDPTFGMYHNPDEQLAFEQPTGADMAKARADTGFNPDLSPQNSYEREQKRLLEANAGEGAPSLGERQSDQPYAKKQDPRSLAGLPNPYPQQPAGPTQLPEPVLQAKSPGVPGQENIGNVPQAPPLMQMPEQVGLQFPEYDNGGYLDIQQLEQILQQRSLDQVALTPISSSSPEQFSLGGVSGSSQSEMPGTPEGEYQAPPPLPEVPQAPPPSGGGGRRS